MVTRITTFAIVLGLVLLSNAAGGQADGKVDEAALPELLKLEPIKEDRPDIDSPPIAEIYRLQRARYNVALEEVQTKSKLFTAGRCEQSSLLAAFKRLKSAEYDLPGRARDGLAAVAANRKWLDKELAFWGWLEGIVLAKVNSDVVPRHDLLEVQFYHLEAKAKQAGYAFDDKKSATN